MIKKITLVTGAGRGIGEETAVKFLKNGHFVYFLVHKKNQKLYLERKLNKFNSYKIFQGDLTDRIFINHISKKIKYCDNLVNNAAITNKKFFTEVSENEFDNLINVNLKSVFLLSQIFSKKMIKNKINGNIINLSSQLGHVGAYNRSIYCVSKFGIEGLTKSIALDLAKHNIRVNSISPTKVITHKNEEKIYKKRINLIKNKIPIKKFPTAKEIASVIFFVCENSETMTGSNLRVDGGWTAGR